MPPSAHTRFGRRPAAAAPAGWRERGSGSPTSFAAGTELPPASPRLPVEAAFVPFLPPGRGRHDLGLDTGDDLALDATSPDGHAVDDSLSVQLGVDDPVGEHE